MIINEERGRGDFSLFCLPLLANFNLKSNFSSSLASHVWKFSSYKRLIISENRARNHEKKGSTDTTDHQIVQLPKGLLLAEFTLNI
jgi:hypothetical protein